MKDCIARLLFCCCPIVVQAAEAPPQASHAQECPRSFIQRHISGKYELGEKVGEGSQGIVFRIHSVVNGEVFALKYFNPSATGHLEGSSDLENTVAISQSLEDLPALTRLVEWIGSSILIMEFVEGEELEKYLEKDLSNEEIVQALHGFKDIFNQIIEKRVIPLDISDDNLMHSSLSNGLRVIDPAYFLDLNLLERDLRVKYGSENFMKSPVKIYTDDYFITTEDGERIHPTIGFALKASAYDVFGLYDSFMKKLGVSWRDKLPPGIGERVNGLDREIATYGDLLVAFEEYKDICNALEKAAFLVKRPQKTSK